MPLTAAQPQGADLLPRIHAYVERFQRELPSIVAEEHYLQVVTNTNSPSADAIADGRVDPVASVKRVLRSDVLMITVPGTMADAITQAGGLGLARTIADDLKRSGA